jgi:hypothetical protein
VSGACSDGVWVLYQPSPFTMSEAFWEYWRRNDEHGSARRWQPKSIEISKVEHLLTVSDYTDNRNWSLWCWERLLQIVRPLISLRRKSYRCWRHSCCRCHEALIAHVSLRSKRVVHLKGFCKRRWDPPLWHERCVLTEKMTGYWYRIEIRLKDVGATSLSYPK